MTKTLHAATLRVTLAGLLVASMLAPRAARAEASVDDPQDKLEDPPASPPASRPASPPAPPRATWRKDGTWGWFVTASSVFLGGAVTSVGLSISCEDGANTACERRTSMLIWGGIGIAALGSVIGLTVVAAGRDRASPPVPVALGFKPTSGVARVCRAEAPER